MTFPELLKDLFSPFCHQILERTWAPGGAPLPFCQRCTGFYAGAALAVALYGILRPRLTTRFLAAHGALLAAMVPFGLGWIPHSAGVRTITGGGFGLAIVALLAPLPMARLRKSGLGNEGSPWLYASAAGAAIVGLTAAARWGDAVTAGILSLLGAAGLAALASGALVNLVCLAAAAWRSCRPASQEAPPLTHPTAS